MARSLGHNIDDLNVERLFMPKLPPKMKQHLLLKTPKVRAHIAKQAQQLLDLAKLNGPEVVEQMKSAMEGGLEQLNHEADLYPLDFKQSLKEMEMIEAMTKAEAMPFVALAGIPVALYPRIRKCELAHFL
eukprot:symbB.v1.2.007320.t1/scaffold447.1/size204395/17